MDTMEAILTRHSIPKVKPEGIPRPVIEKLLKAAVQAPNHYHVRPWRFVVMTGRGREQLGAVMAETLKAQHPEMPESGLDIERAKPLRAPVLIAVGVDRPGDPRVLEIENICAAAAAIENLLLAARAEGLGAMWRTGAAARDPEVKKFLGFEPDQPLIGFVYVGIPDIPLELNERPSFADRTRWMD